MRIATGVAVALTAGLACCAAPCAAGPGGCRGTGGGGAIGIRPGAGMAGVRVVPGGGGAGMITTAGFYGGGGFRGYGGFGGFAGGGFGGGGFAGPFGAAGMVGVVRPGAAPYRGAVVIYQPNRSAARPQASRAPLQGAGLRESSDQTAVARSMERISERRPIREGTVAAVGPREIEVHYMDGAAIVSQKLPPEEVFFFRRNGDLKTAAAAPGELRAGDRVMVPEPETPRK